MTKNNKFKLKIIYIFLYTATLITLFVTTKNNGGILKGDMIPWILGIATGLFGIAVSFPFNKRKCKLNMDKIILLSILMIINLLSIIFSILDIVGIKNYIVTAIIFVTATPITISSLFKLDKN
ncbi:hypothetical protein MYMA111404_01950 [Mycoplasma marinum]|uniref:Uncharacterized protein n=2 Tax=Mycoplasma marinum TaxID=1937190 RepID=A0A4R0XVM5_9MOLU|nr:hypothetical protein [Mycoplasma marinum]TCG11913.1 hypothetical protein C4B24_00760 [Mycoplasma marinum]